MHQAGDRRRQEALPAEAHQRVFPWPPNRSADDVGQRQRRRRAPGHGAIVRATVELGGWRYWSIELTRMTRRSARATRPRPLPRLHRDARRAVEASRKAARDAGAPSQSTNFRQCPRDALGRQRFAAAIVEHQASPPAPSSASRAAHAPGAQSSV